MLLGLWWWSTSASNPTRACAVRHRLVTFGVAFALALLAASALKWGLDFPRPPAVLGTLVHVIGVAELRYSLPSGHATYAALVVGALWPLMGRRGHLALVCYAALVGWSRIAAGMHFPADVLAGWTLGAGCVVVAGHLVPLLAATWRNRGTPNAVWYGVAACCFMADQAAKFAITRMFAYGERVEITSTFNLVYVRNPGAAFSFLANEAGWQRYLFYWLGPGCLSVVGPHVAQAVVSYGSFGVQLDPWRCSGKSHRPRLAWSGRGLSGPALDATPLAGIQPC